MRVKRQPKKGNLKETFNRARAILKDEVAGADFGSAPASSLGAFYNSISAVQKTSPTQQD
jgi:hypothetical protein